MLFSEFFTVALIPSLISTNPENNPDNLDYNNRAVLNSRRLQSSSSSQDGTDFEDEFFKNGNNGALTAPTPVTTDPVLLDIYEEERRLHLAGGDYDMRSEEARELINFQRRKLNRQRDESSRFTASNILPKGRSLHIESPSTDLFHNSESDSRVASSKRANLESETEYPIVVPTTEGHQESTTKKPNTGFLSIGSFFNSVSTGIEKAANRIPIPSWKRSPSSSTTAPPSLENLLPSTPSAPNVFNTDNVETAYRRLNLNCTEFQTIFKGECHNVLQNKECPTGQWLIEDDETKMGKCVNNRCAHLPNHAYFDGKCIKPYEESGGHCHKGMKPLIFKNGDVECDCKDQHLYYHKDGNCYPAYTQGPCESRELLVSKFTQNGATAATCVKNKCSKDDYFCNAPSCPKDRNCIQLNTGCKTTIDRKEKEGKWGIHPDSLSPACIPLDFDLDRPGKLIGNVPTLACAPGSRRDILGTCRKPSKMTFS